LNALIKDQYVNYSVVGAPTFVAVGDPARHIRMEFTIERHDMSKSWCTSRETFMGSVELERVDDVTVKVTMKHTAAETKSLGQSVRQSLVKHFRDTARMAREGGITEVLFKSFTNESRVQFFLDLTVTIAHEDLKFLKVTDANISPEPGVEMAKELRLLMQGLDELRIKGKNLQHHPLIKKKRYHSKLLFSKMQTRLKFKLGDIQGECVVSYEFTEFDLDVQSADEFEIDIPQISLNSDGRLVNKRDLKERLLRVIDLLAHRQFKRMMELRSQPASPSAPSVIGMAQANLPLG
jgi:hypothetical protein